MIVQLYGNLGINAITMVISDSSYNVSSLPFPAITFFGTFGAITGFVDYFVTINIDEDKNEFIEIAFEFRSEFMEKIIFK